MKADVQSTAEKEALEWAIKYFRDNPGHLKLQGDSAVDFFAARKLWANDPKRFDNYIELRILAAGGYPGHKGESLSRPDGKPAWNSALTIRGLCRFAAILIDEGEPLPELLRLFVAAFLINPVLRGRGSPGPKRGGLLLRNVTICGVIEHIKETWKFLPTRNDATEKISAAAIVRKALAAVQIPLTEKAINGIWGELNQHVDRAPGALEFMVGGVPKDRAD